MSQHLREQTVDSLKLLEWQPTLSFFAPSNSSGYVSLKIQFSHRTLETSLSRLNDPPWVKKKIYKLIYKFHQLNIFLAFC